MFKSARLFIILVLAILPFALVNAQDEATEESASSVMLVQGASSGTLEAGADDLYTLTLDVFTDSLQWVDTGDMLRAGYYPSIDFQGDWEFASTDEELSLEAILTTENETVTLMLTAPVYDEESFAYTVSIVSIQSFDPDADPEKLELPESFDAATLFIPLDDATIEMLYQGSLERLNSTRDASKPTCTTPRC